uniref:von Willebrand factor A domain containing 5B1 n=1 Tax=Sinocyclocheilus grahami TaxID=75366 RepID=A0A672NRG8_SINGR
MLGLINKSKWSALPLSISDISSCVRGYTLAMTASLTYENIEDHPIEGIFIYPLDEGSVVAGFEAMIGSQIITVQVKDKTKIEDCFFDCCNALLMNSLAAGHIVLDEDQERTVLVVSLGVIPPLETINILVSTSSELRTLPKGGIRVTSPPVCSPRVQRSVKEEQAFSPSTPAPFVNQKHIVGAHEQMASGVCLAAMLEEETINSIDYEFNFHLEIRGPYLLAGVESPSHAIRADADPSARSATSIVVTLADKYTYDCPVEILIYPSEPHLPHVLIEDGDMTPEEYDEHLKGRSDYIKATKKDITNEKTVDIIRKRLHKDILHNPVVMLNFCPNLSSTTSDLRSIQGEFIFLIDRSGSMSGVNINRVKDAMVVILKSLFPACLFNIVGFGSKFKTLFVTSQSYNEESLALACEHVKKIRADMGGTNILAPLNWILRQPMQRGHPRLLFLLTDGAVSNTGKVIELLRSHARFTRCYTFGIGQGACRRLVLGLAAVSRGTAEFLAEGERLQPKMIKSLKKSMTSVLTDISIEWLYPETKEILLSPVGVSCLFPGDRLIGYSVVCDTSRYHSNPKSVSHPSIHPSILKYIHRSAIILCINTHTYMYILYVCMYRYIYIYKCGKKISFHYMLPSCWKVQWEICMISAGTENHSELLALAPLLCSIIQDFEHMADKECEIEHGSGRRHQLYAIHTSKACNVLSKYTAFVPIDLDSNEYLPTFIEYSHPGRHYGFYFLLQVLLQLSCGAFMLDSALCDAINVPMDKLKWTSPFTSHRISLTHELVSQIAETPWLGSPGILQRAMQDPEGMVWATAVALAWLEHNSASYFIEWELIAAKASMWLDEQIIPEGRDLAAVKAAANQLFIILRHWDENLQLNMLCYNPNSM